MKLCDLVKAARDACVAGVMKVREYQLNAAVVLNVQKKSDSTLLTLADIASQKAMQGILEQAGFAFWGEEGERNAGFIGAGRYGAIVDPLDGTNAFVIGLPTPTIIVGVYDREEKKIIACVIGEPVSGRIWEASEETETLNCGNPRCVWSGSETGSIFIDVCHGFKSRGRQVLTDHGNAALYASLNQRYRILMPGSNGLMQALVANGNERMAGAITTAVGFPGDVCGALLVKQAGGFLKAYERTKNGDLVKTDPLDPLQIDALICSNTEETLYHLAAAFEAAAKIG